MASIFRPAPDELADIDRLLEGINALSAKHSSPRLVDLDGADIAFPPSIFAATARERVESS